MKKLNKTTAPASPLQRLVGLSRFAAEPLIFVKI